jgi:hypothetical protein
MASPTSSAGHAPTGATTNPKLTSQPDHPTGADQTGARRGLANLNKQQLCKEMQALHQDA